MFINYRPLSYPFRTQIITHSLKDPSGDATQTSTTTITNCDNEIPCDTTTENENNNLKQSTSCTSDDSEGGARRLVTFFCFREGGDIGLSIC